MTACVKCQRKPAASDTDDPRAVERGICTDCLVEDILNRRAALQTWGYSTDEQRAKQERQYR